MTDDAHPNAPETVAPKPRVRKSLSRPHGAWYREILPHFAEYRRIAPADRPRFVRDIATELGLAENSARRQFTGLLYLAERGIDPATLSDDPPALLAIEAVARLARLDPAKEAKALEELRKGEATIDKLRKLCKQTAEEDVQPPYLGARDPLSTHVFIALAERGWLPEAFFHAGPDTRMGDWIAVTRLDTSLPYSPRCLVRCGERQFAVHVVEGLPAGQKAYRQDLLVEGAVLRSYAIYGHALVWIGWRPSRLLATLECMPEARRDAIVVKEGYVLEHLRGWEDGRIYRHDLVLSARAVHELGSLGM